MSVTSPFPRGAVGDMRPEATLIHSGGTARDSHPLPFIPRNVVMVIVGDRRGLVNDSGSVLRAIFGMDLRLTRIGQEIVERRGRHEVGQGLEVTRRQASADP